MKQYDLVIIGSGSGNSIPDERFNELSVAIIEKGTYGGTCLNVGCLPTKMFVYPSDIAREITEVGKLGIDAHVNQVHWEAIRDRVFNRIDPISAGGLRYRKHDCPNIDVYQGETQFVDSTDGYTLSIDGHTTIKARKVVIAAGSRPIIPDVITRSGVPYHTNETIMRIEKLPEHLIIVGSGFIACEFAHIFSALGTTVSIIARSGALLRSHDDLISAEFTKLATQQWGINFNASITAVHGTDGTIEVELQDGKRITGDALLVATGRRPNGDTLNVEAAGLHLDEAGRIPVDAQQRTQAHNIFALGDVSSLYQLKHVANHEARVVQNNVLLDFFDTTAMLSSDHRYVPSAVFTHPQIASVGLTEKQAREQHLPIVTSEQKYGDIGYGWAMEDTTGICKIIAHADTRLLLGVHILGFQAPTIIQTMICAMSFGIPTPELARGQYWIHPALPELLENALLGLEYP